MKRYALICFVCFISMYFLLAGIFGSSGALYNQSLRVQIREKQMKSEKLSLEIKNLENREQNMSTEEGLRDSAIGLGLYVEGDTVYLFDSPSLQNKVVINQIDSIKTYEPLSTVSIILLALCISIIITFAIWFLSRDNNSDDEDMKQIQGGTDLYINA